MWYSNLRKSLFIGFSTLIIVLVVFIVAASVLGRFKQAVTTGAHITKIQVGTGLDQTTGAIQGETDTFQDGATVYVSFTVVNQNPNATVTLKLLYGTIQKESDELTPEVGTTQYGDSASVQTTGEHAFEVDYNGAKEATITFNIT